MADDPHPSNAPPLFGFQSRRSVVFGTRGMVACTNPIAAQAGIKILEAGGNAADAAVAVAAVLGVVDPSMTGIGGDVFALFYNTTTGDVKALNASGRSPMNATRQDACVDNGVPVVDGKMDEDAAKKTSISGSSRSAVTVPGAAAGWVDTVEHFGSGAVTLSQVLGPAIQLAERGFPVSRLSAYYWTMTEQDLQAKSRDGSACELLVRDASTQSKDGSRPGYRAPREGEIFRCPELAATLRLLAEHGKDGFYRGPVAEAIVAALKTDRGEWITLEDLQCQAERPPDIADALSMVIDSVTQHGHVRGPIRLWEHPPNGQGIVALLAAGILQELQKRGTIPSLPDMEHNSAAYLHAVISALRIAFADAGHYVSDPAFPEDKSEDEQNKSFASKLLSPDYISQRADLFRVDKAPTNLVPGNLNEPVEVAEHSAIKSLPTSDTVYLSVTDEAGNGCSYVNSVSDRFGSCIVPKGTGFALQNRGRMFRLGPADHPNVFAGNKRAYNTIIPGLVTEDVVALGTVSPEKQKNRLRSVFGVMGGLMQPQGHLQVLLNMHAFGFDPQTALDAPRVCIAASMFASLTAEEERAKEIVYIEEGIPTSVFDELRGLGHNVRCLTGYARSLFGRGQVINVEHDPLSGERVYVAGSDPRGDGHAVPFV